MKKNRDIFIKNLTGDKIEMSPKGRCANELSVEEFECAAREGEEPGPEDVEDYVKCLVEAIPYAGIGVDL